jgi:hypothetical protein
MKWKIKFMFQNTNQYNNPQDRNRINKVGWPVILNTPEKNEDFHFATQLMSVSMSPANPVGGALGDGLESCQDPVAGKV